MMALVGLFSFKAILVVFESVILNECIGPFLNLFPDRYVGGWVIVSSGDSSEPVAPIPVIWLLFCLIRGTKCESTSSMNILG